MDIQTQCDDTGYNGYDVAGEDGLIRSAAGYFGVVRIG
jgi:hypothetical protein